MTVSQLAKELRTSPSKASTSLFTMFYASTRFYGCMYARGRFSDQDTT